MKNAFFFALSCLLMVTALTLPAIAATNFSVVNDSTYPVKVDVVFYTSLCSDDHYTLAPKQRRDSWVGLCKTKSFSAVMTDGKGAKHLCFIHEGAIGGKQYRIALAVNPVRFCEVSR